MFIEAGTCSPGPLASLNSQNHLLKRFISCWSKVHCLSCVYKSHPECTQLFLSDTHLVMWFILDLFLFLWLPPMSFSYVTCRFSLPIINFIQVHLVLYLLSHSLLFYFSSSFSTILIVSSVYYLSPTFHNLQDEITPQKTAYVFHSVVFSLWHIPCNLFLKFILFHNSIAHFPPHHSSPYYFILMYTSYFISISYLSTLLICWFHLSIFLC